MLFNASPETFLFTADPLFPLKSLASPVSRLTPTSICSAIPHRSSNGGQPGTSAQEQARASRTNQRPGNGIYSTNVGSLKSPLVGQMLSRACLLRIKAEYNPDLPDARSYWSHWRLSNLTGMKDKDKDALPGRFMLKEAKSTISCLMNCLGGCRLAGFSCPLIQIYAES